MADSNSKNWVAVVALSTAVVGLGAAVVQYQGAQSAKEAAVIAGAKADSAEERARNLEVDLRANQAKLSQQVQAQKMLMDAQEKQNICEDLRLRRLAVDQRFSDLQYRSGTLLSFIKNCVKGPESDRGVCLVAICSGAAYLTDGKSNCLAVGAEVSAIRDDAKNERENAVANGCDAPISTAETYFE